MFCWVLRGSAGLCWAVLDSVVFFWGLQVLLGSAGFLWALLSSAVFCWALLGSSGFY